MPKKLIKRYLPNPEKLKKTKGFSVLGSWLHNPNIWHLNRHSVARAFVIGLFWMAIPIPSQMIAAAISAIIFRANLPISVALVWISNPFTMAPIFYFNYVIGTLILGQKADENIEFSLTWNWLINTLGDVWLPLYLGSLVVGISIGLMSYIAIKLFWRLQVSNSWKKRLSQKNKYKDKR